MLKSIQITGKHNLLNFQPKYLSHSLHNSQTILNTPTIPHHSF